MSFIDMFRKKKKVKEPEMNSYRNCNKVILNKNIEHQGIGGKTAYIEREVSIYDILRMITNYNIAALNFYERRRDLFKKIKDLSLPDDKLVKRKARYKTMKYYYVKIWQSDGKNGTYLGYFIASDECLEYIKSENVKEDSIWI